MNGLPERYAVNIETRCWEWCGELNRKGYGRLWAGGRRYFAHRAYYEAEHGPIPEGFEIDHLCRNTSCVNPAHLEAVTPRENQLRARKGRSFLTESDVAFIRGSDLPQAELAERFGVSQSTVSEARRGVTFGDDPRPYSVRRRSGLGAAA